MTCSLPKSPSSCAVLTLLHCSAVKGAFPEVRVCVALSYENCSSEDTDPSEDNGLVMAKQREAVMPRPPAWTAAERRPLGASCLTLPAPAPQLSSHLCSVGPGFCWLILCSCPATVWHRSHHGPCQASGVILPKPPHVLE